MWKQPSQKTRTARHALTLLELIIVMVILVAVASMAISVVFGSFSAQRIAKAGDLVRAEMNRARVEAMRTGEIHGLFYFPGTPNFVVAPFNNETVSLMTTRQRRNTAGQTNYEYGQELLPKGVLFSTGQVIADARGEAAFEEQSGAVGNVRPVLFYPDGSTQNALLYLQNDQQQAIAIKLRGMTGATSVAAVNVRGR